VVWSVIEELRDGGATIVLVTHFMQEAERLCDRLALIDRGRIRALDTAAGIIDRTGAPVVMSFSPSRPFDAGALVDFDGVGTLRQFDGRVEAHVTDDAALAILGWLAANDIRPVRLRITESTLDDAYIDLLRHDEGEAATEAD
jgi:ABC-2 type transport system ATP-binding protein